MINNFFIFFHKFDYGQINVVCREGFTEIRARRSNSVVKHQKQALNFHKSPPINTILTYLFHPLKGIKVSIMDRLMGLWKFEALKEFPNQIVGIDIGRREVGPSGRLFSTRP